MINRLFTIIPLCCLTLIAPLLSAAEYTNSAPLCRGLESNMPKPPTTLQDDVAHPNTHTVYLSAKQLTVLNVPNFMEETEKEPNLNQIYQFTGNVFLQRGQQMIKAQNLQYKKMDAQVEAKGDVTLWDDTMIARSPEVILTKQHTGTAKDARYWLLARPGHGSAEQITQHNPQYIELEETRYTTCFGDKPAWQLRSRKTELDLQEDIGTARDVKLYLGQWPVFYTPYITFPLSDKRKSGFLSPSFGYSKEHGAEISTPYYWNIAPHYDATISPMLMTRRGLRLNTEARYLTEHSQGVWEGAYLANDREFDDEKRYQIKIEHLTQFTPRLNAMLAYNEVSDNKYFIDFGNTLETNSTTHLERHVGFNYLGSWYLLQGQLQNYQTLVKGAGARPYARLPQLTWQTLIPEQNKHWHWKAAAEYTYFDRNILPEDLTASIDQRTGHRAHTSLNFSLPWRQSWGFFKPKLTGYFTQYALNNTDDTQDSRHSRTLYSLSADSGLLLDRNFAQGKMLQTLEPRLFYLHIPYKDQSDIPIFDSAEYDFSFSQMFRENRFVGNDRIGDENRVAVALTSRFLNTQDGEEYLRVSLGQTYHFKDRRVTLNTVDSSNSSDIITEVAARIAKDLTAAQTLQWDSDDRTLVRSSTRLRYHNLGAGQIINLAYRSRNNVDTSSQDIEQADVSWYWPLNKHWSTIGRWNYSLEHGKNLETFAGFEYNSCCWAVRLIGRRYFRNFEGDYATGAFLQVELKGLAGLGRNTSNFLNESIAGFEERLDAY